MLNLDPALLDQNKTRLKKRKHLLKVYFVPILVLLFAAAFFIRTGIYNIFLSLESKSQTYSVIPTLSVTGAPINFLEPYISFYNDGYIKTVNATSHQDLDKAIDSFRESLKNNPPEYVVGQIYNNISYAMELQADKKAEIRDYNEAIKLYNRAEAVSRQYSVKNRIAEKRDKTIAALNHASYNNEDGSASINISDEELNNIKNEQKEIDKTIRYNLRLNQLNNN